jgi:signal transduction histidine kinase
MNTTARLLVVDDEVPQLQALDTVLRAEGHEVVACSAPAEALVQLRQQRFDVLLSDLNMPQMDGITLAREALEIDPDIVPVLMTGQGTISTAVEAMKVGALDYVLKPFKLAAIRPVLHRAIEMGRLRVSNRQLEQDVARHARQLEAANHELDAFAARIAHDLRNPVVGILGLTRIVKRKNTGHLDETSLGHLQSIITAAERADRMILDLLAFARLGETPLQRAPVDLDKLLHAARAMVEREAEGRQVDWRIGPLPTVLADASLLEHVFVNLLSNAVKYTRPRERALIEVESLPAAAGAHTIRVRDNGVGFDPRGAGQLFSPFHRLHRHDEFEGNGIGLANVKRIVERHGGTVTAQAQPDVGAVFSVTLPA